MAEHVVKCAKLSKELPGIDESTAEGNQALMMCLMLGGPDLQQRVRENISLEAWKLWADHMRMVMNEYRLDPTSDEADAVLKQHLEAFLFGEGKAVRNYVPPSQ